jgi:isoleucyl-tRNA synthetase
VWAANDHVLDVMRENGALLFSEPFEHSYPHCWRHKTPTAFRVTPQWFISMDKAGLRKQSLAAIGAVSWIPGWGEERIRGMIENRPDWCISRQRTWGVPIPLFVNPETNETHPETVELMGRVADIVEERGVDYWYSDEIYDELGVDSTTGKRLRTFSTSGSIRVSHTAAYWTNALTWNGRPRSTSKVRTSTGDGSSPPCCPPSQCTARRRMKKC